MGSNPGPRFDWSLLFEVLKETTDHECSDPRDRLFALLSLFKGAPPPQLKVNYALSFEELCMRVGIYLIDRGGYRVFVAAGGIANLSGLPTWLIDLRKIHRTLEEREDRSGRGPNRHLFALGDAGSHGYIKQISERSIMIRGTRLGSITQVREWAPSNWKYPPFFLMVQSGHGVPIVYGAGFQGLARTGCQPGDCVCALADSDLGVVLRQSDSAWNLVGDCWSVYAMQDVAGEALQEYDRLRKGESLACKEFVIC